MFLQIFYSEMFRIFDCRNSLSLLTDCGVTTEFKLQWLL